MNKMESLQLTEPLFKATTTDVLTL